MIGIVLFFAASTLLWSFIWMKTQIRLNDSKSLNTELQKENSRMIKRYLSLQSKLNTSRELLRKKKELLEIQDKVVQQLQEEIINHKVRVIYKFSEGIENLKRNMTIGKEYLFSDMLQEEKSFKVEWKKGVLNKIEQHPDSANCFVSDGQYFLYAKKIP